MRTKNAKAFTAAERAHLQAVKPKAVHFSWSKVDVGEAHECWLWIGARNRYGYGACQHLGVQMNASRAAYLLTHSSIPDGQVICHRCDVPACCNPAHLFAATQAENIADCKRKGRWRNRRGEAHPRPNAKLTADMIREARRLYAGGVSQSEIGRRIGMHSSAISRAVRGETWSHVK